MSEYAEVPVASLLFDQENPRLPEIAGSQLEAAVALAQVVTVKAVLAIAEHIVENGINRFDPMYVVPTAEDAKRYVVHEGNRRLLALRTLETPSLLASVLSRSELQRLERLGKKYSSNPIETVPCAVFDSREEAMTWVRLRHSGYQGGIGLKPWEPPEKERFEVRYGDKRREPIGHVIEFLVSNGVIQRSNENARTPYYTNLKRLLSTPRVRKALGIDYVDGGVVSHFPIDEAKRVLGGVATQFATEAKTVKDIYHVGDRLNFVNDLPPEDLPDPAKRLSEPVPLGGVVAAGTGGVEPAAPPRERASRSKPSRQRTSLIPKSVSWDIVQPRLNRIYVELKGLDATTYQNAAAVLLRVFVELSVDHYISGKRILTESELRSAPLAKKLKVVAEHLFTTGAISEKLKRAVVGIADRGRLLAASTVTLHQYVHNEYVIPKGSEIFDGWDELQPFLEKVWGG